MMNDFNSCLSNGKNFVVNGRSAASNFAWEKPWVCISIATHEGDWPKINKVQQLGHLQLHFADADHPVFKERMDRMGTPMFDKEHAAKILDFVNKHWDEAELFMFHCEAGMSRSPAIAAAIMKIKGLDDSVWFARKTPNAHVYRVLLETAHERGEYGPVEDKDMPDIEGKFNW
jgi:predicted protein tyrosine phosphatase